VFLSYASPAERTVIDRRVYLPRSWADGPRRCAAVSVPADAGFATKPQLALDMITEAVRLGCLSPWVASDEAYGDNGASPRRGSPPRPGLCAGGLLPDRGANHLPETRLQHDHTAHERPGGTWQAV
jgi:DDE superfamily endonuclease